jgi:hypothetical protein
LYKVDPKDLKNTCVFKHITDNLGSYPDSSILYKPSKMAEKIYFSFIGKNDIHIKSSLWVGTCGLTTLLVLMSIIETPCSVPTHFTFKRKTFLVLFASRPA